jgi:iron complex outermembrane recepter protein
MNRRFVAVVLFALTRAADGATTLAARDLADLSLEQLSNIVVSSVSGRDEPLGGAPASVYVISADEIRRSGATSIPEALRLAPNLQVAHVDANQWAISARGFNATLANKLLVLIDGRTVYTPLFSGTFWEAQEVMLEDVERIEVISGPGATLWGANAVNGVINILTRSSAATQGTLATVGMGTDGRHVAARYGGRFGDATYRIYAKNARRDASAVASGESNRDDAEHTQVGFRSDWERSGDRFTVQSDAYTADANQIPVARNYSGFNLVGRWTREFGEGSRLRTQIYFDTTDRHHPGTFRESLDTYDLDVQHTLRARGVHRLLWGFGARQHRDQVENSPGIAFLPPDRRLWRHHVFVQDEIALRRDLDLTLGAKSESNTYTGAEFLPSVRLAWRPGASHLVWTALSRAVRAPSRVDRDLFSPANPPFALAGGPEFRSEVANVLELGYRGQPSARVSYSATAFHHDYQHLRTLRPTPGGLMVANDREGTVSGIETWGTWRPAQWWRLSGGLTRLHTSFSLSPGAVDAQAPASERADPNGWWKVRAAFDLGASSEVDVLARHYGALDTRDAPSYTAIDARYAWHATRRIELSLVLQNIFDRGHVEWAPGADWGRAALAKIRIEL